MGPVNFVDEDAGDEPRPTADDAEEEIIMDDKILFANAKEKLPPGRFFRMVMWLYAERKMVMLSMIHFVATMVIWTHFGLIKFQEQEKKVKEGANRFYWKRTIPPLEFGSMHAILFQMTLLPLTMSRFSIASLSGTIIDRFVPLNRTLQMHIHLGYTMVLIVFVATIVFFTFFGLLCNDGEQKFCDNFTSEIMGTGYGILASLLIIAGTSYFRYKIPYEIFYMIHHLVFAMYILTIAHTIDNVELRNERTRSQTFKWFSAPLLYYACDRAMMYINHRYHTPVVSSIAVEGGGGARMLILKLQRPTLFEFKPGQYAFLRLSELDVHWHPFSIASNPSSPYLEFYIEVFAKDSWTGKLYDKLKNASGRKSFVTMEVLGPYGTALVNREGTTNVLSIGAGTGIVPVLSLFQEHVKRMLLLDPAAHLVELQEAERTAVKVKLAREARQAPVVANVATMGCCNTKELEQSQSTDDKRRLMMQNTISQASSASTYQDVVRTRRRLQMASLMVTRSIYGAVLQTFLGAFGVMVIGLTISWNTIKIDLYPHMTTLLQIFAIIFQSMFAVAAVFFWRGRNFFTYIDICMVVISVFSDWYWNIIYDQDGTLPGTQITTITLLLGYMMLRFWSKTVGVGEGQETKLDRTGLSAIERLDVVWVTRSANLVSRVIPDIERRYSSLVKAWGEEYAKEVCRVTVYVTDKDPEAVKVLKQEIQHMTLYRNGHVNFCRPDFGNLIEGHTLDMIDSRSYSTSLLAFCGSPQLSGVIRQNKIANEMVTATTGFKHHTMDFISESYGGVKAPAQIEDVEENGADVESGKNAEEEDESEDVMGEMMAGSSALNSRSSMSRSAPSMRFNLSFAIDDLEDEDGEKPEVAKEATAEADDGFVDRQALMRSYSSRASGLRRSSRAL